jgi:hypothetical protein
MSQQAERAIIGVDPHKLSATVEVVDQREQMLGSGRFATDRAGYAAMKTYAKKWPERVWAVEGSNGAGRPLAQRLLEDGEQVVDVPAKLAARVRLFDTGHNRKTDAHDAHAVAAVAVRTKTCGCCSSTVSSKPYGCSPTAAKHSPAHPVVIHQGAERLTRPEENQCTNVTARLTAASASGCEMPTMLPSWFA